jgi:hypothetical protein
LAQAPVVSYTLTERPWLPNRPANVLVDGTVAFNTLLTPHDMTGAPDVPTSWANRNRMLEDGLVLAWTDGDVTPETGQTTTITVLDEDGVTVLDTHTGLTGTSFDVPAASFGSADIAILRFSASRTDADGTFDSLQWHDIYVQVLPGSELLEVSQLSTSVDITAATISALAADNSLNDSGSGFVAAGFAIGDRVHVEGFTGDVANNIFVGIITALTTAKMTIGGTDGDVIVDDAAGESVTISKWETHRTLLDDIAAYAAAAPGGISIQSVASSATVTPTFADDQVNITAQAAGLTLANPTGTAQDGHGISIRIKDNGTARSIGYGTQYRAIGVTLPTTTVISKTLYLGMIFNAAETKWDVVAVAQEA